MTRLSPEKPAAHIASLEAELTLTRNALLDLLQESHAYAAGKADTAAWVRRWWEDDSRPWRELSEWLGAQSHPPDGALLARLAEALEALRKIVSVVEPDFPKLAGQDEVVEIHLLHRPDTTWTDGVPGLTVGHIRRAAEILQRNKKAPAAAPPGPTEM